MEEMRRWKSRTEVERMGNEMGGVKDGNRKERQKVKGNEQLGYSRREQQRRGRNLINETRN